jgi:hypothetical protein
VNSAVDSLKNNFDNRELSGSLNFRNANPNAILAFFRTLKQLNDIDNGKI